MKVELDAAIASAIGGVASAAASALVVDAGEHDDGWFAYLTEDEDMPVVLSGVTIGYMEPWIL